MDAKNRASSYEVLGATGPIDYQIGHVSDEVSRQAEVEEHVANSKEHFSCVLSMEVAVASGRQRCDGEVDRRHVSEPHGIFLEARNGCADPRCCWLRVPVGDHVAEAS